MDLIAGKNSTWLNPPHLGGIIDPDTVCNLVYCVNPYIGTYTDCPIPGFLCESDYVGCRG